MSIVGRLAALAAFLLLSACFQSEQPLIAEEESVTPIAPGAYLSSNPNDQGRKFVVSLNGRQTKVAIVTSKGEEDATAYLMRPVRENYFAVMLPGSPAAYGLIRVQGAEVMAFDEGGFCQSLQEIAFARNVALPSLGVTKLQNNTCFFDKFEALANALGAIVEANKAPPKTIFKRIGR